MFKDDYTQAINKILPNEEKKEKILTRLQTETILKNKKHKNPAMPWRIGFAVTACTAILLSIIFIPKTNLIVSNNNPKEQQSLKSAKSYDKIYNILNSYAKKQNYDEYYEIIEYYTGIETTGTTNFNANAEKSAANTDSNGSFDDTNKTKSDYSATNSQVEGVDEADIIKTDGKYIYYLYNSYLQIVRADSANSRLINTLTLPEEKNRTNGDMFLYNDRLVIISKISSADNISYDTAFYEQCEELCEITIYDVSKPEDIKKIGSYRQSGAYENARMIGGTIYVITNTYIDCKSMKKSKPETYVPNIECENTSIIIPAEAVMLYDEEISSSVFLTICSYASSDASIIDKTALLGGTNEIYCSTKNIITAKSRYYTDNTEGYSYTELSRFSLNNGKIEYCASGKINGQLDNQFAMDEYRGFFRFVTTVESSEIVKSPSDSSYYSKIENNSYAALYVLNENLKTVGSIENIADGEQVYSVRFMGDTAYFVTFRKTDPLFSADLSDPENPKIIGQLKIPGFSEYLYPYGENMLLGLGLDADENTGEQGNLKLSMFNISNPCEVTESNKLIIDAADYSYALKNHKSTLINANKNLIGFSAISYTTPEDTLSYKIYGYNDRGFELKANFDIKSGNVYTFSQNVRGLFIDDTFYLVTPLGLNAYTMTTFSTVCTLEFKGYSDIETIMR